MLLNIVRMLTGLCPVPLQDGIVREEQSIYGIGEEGVLTAIKIEIKIKIKKC